MKRCLIQLEAMTLNRAFKHGVSAKCALAHSAILPNIARSVVMLEAVLEAWLQVCALDAVMLQAVLEAMFARMCVPELVAVLLQAECSQR
jgi:hypothetical protein